MARLPTVGADDNDWGDVLNEYLEVSHTDTGRHKFIVANVAYAATITPDIDADIISIGTLTGDVTIANPSGTPVDGQLLMLRFKQDSTGARTVAWGNAYSFQTTSSAPVIPTAADARWEMTFRWNSGTTKYELISISSDEPTARAEVAYTAAIPFNRLVTKIGSHTITGPITLTPNTAGALPGCGAILELTADGVHTPDFSAFTEFTSSPGWDNTAGKINQCIFIYNGDRYAVSITQYDILTPLSAPASFSATAISATQINLSWADVSNEVNYELQRGTAADYSDATTINSPAANATSYNNTGLSASTHYYYRIRAVGDDVTFSTSSWVNANAVTSDPAQLNAPALSGGPSFTWTDTNSSPNESSFQLQIATDSEFGSISSTVNPSADATSSNVTGLSEGDYYARIKAVGNGTTTSDSAWSNTVTFTVVADLTDADAQAYFDAVATAGGSLSDDQKNYINTFVTNQKANGLWTKKQAIYMPIYTTAGPSGINLKNPGTYDLTWISTWTYSTSGATPGTTASANTGVVPSSVLQQDSVHLAVYTQSATLMNTFESLIGSLDDTNYLQLMWNGSDVFANANSGQSDEGSLAPYAGYDIMTRTGPTTTVIYRNGSNVKSISSASTGLPTVPIYISASRNNFGATNYQSVRKWSFVSIGSGLSASEAANDNTDVETLMDSLGIGLQ